MPLWRIRLGYAHQLITEIPLHSPLGSCYDAAVIFSLVTGAERSRAVSPATNVRGSSSRDLGSTKAVVAKRGLSVAHRRMLVLIALLLTLASQPIFSPSNSYAQSGSPVPVGQKPISTGALPQQPDIQPTTEPVVPSDAEGNTPAGNYGIIQIYPRPDVDFNVYEITVGGQTDVIDGANGNGVFDAPGFRADNAKVVTVITTAQHSGNFRLCIIFEDATFANPAP